MERLSYRLLEEQEYKGYLLKDAPERVLQFGEGNFMRAFTDYWIDLLNEKCDFQAKVVLCQPRSKKKNMVINEQEGLYTLFLRGFENGEKVNKKRVVSCISRCLNPYQDYEEFMACAQNPDLRFITCNTTESGIVYDPACAWEDRPASSYPGKLTQFLYERYLYFGKEKGKGFIILSCELIDDNGKELRKCVLQYAKQWNLPEEFQTWIKEENLFCSTLVDRIVTGYPKEEAEQLWNQLGYEDHIMVAGEVFGFWVIEGPDWLKEELPFEKAGLPVLICQDHKPYKQRKVRILNGAHTSMVLGAYLAGQDIVRDCMHDEIICGFMNQTIYEEIVPTLTLPKQELLDFASSVTDRFNNPFIDHALLSISLNSTAKWKARVMPSLKKYVELKKELPKCMTASFAFYLAFYRGRRMEGEVLFGERAGKEYPIQDDKEVLEFYLAHKSDTAAELAHAACTNTKFWGEDLTLIPGFESLVTEYLEQIEKKGTYAVMKNIIKA